MVPAAKPVTVPVLLTDATEVFVDDHVPPGVAVGFDRAIADPAFTVEAPVTTPPIGNGLTVRPFVVVVLPQPLVTV